MRRAKVLRNDLIIQVKIEWGKKPRMNMNFLLFLLIIVGAFVKVRTMMNPSSQEKVGEKVGKKVWELIPKFPSSY